MLILQDVTILVNTALWYTTGVFVVGLFVVAAYLMIEMFGQILGGK